MTESPGDKGNWQSDMIDVEENCHIGRDVLMQDVDAEDVPSRCGIKAIHRELAYFDYRCSIPPTEWASDNNILLAIYNDLAEEQQNYVIRCIDYILPRS